MPAQGLRSFIQFGLQSDYKTFANPTQRLEIINWNVVPVLGVIEDPSLFSAVSRRATYEGLTLFRGTFTVRANYEGLLELFRAAWGNYSSAQVETGVRDHSFREGATLNYLSFQASIGDTPTGKVFNVIGAKLIPTVTLRGTAGQGNDGMVQCEFSVLAADMIENSTTYAINVIGNSWSLGGTAVTRSSGSYITDGVKVGSVVSQVGFPEGTQVTAVNSATSLTVSTAAIAAGIAATVAFSPPLPPILPVLFHQATIMDDGTVEGGLIQATIASLTTTSASAVVTRGAGSFLTDGVAVGQLVAGTGITTGTTVLSVDSATQITLSAVATASGTVSLTFRSLLVRVRSFEITLEQPHTAEERAYFGSDTIDEPLRQDFIKATMRFQQEFTTKTAWAAARAFGVGSPRVMFQHPTTIGAASKREIELQMNNATYRELSPPVEGYGVIICNTVMQGDFDPVNATALFLRVRNTEPALP